MKRTGLNVILLVLSLVLTIGIRVIFPACGPMEDGSYMRCHWTESAVFGVSIVITIASVAALFLKNNDLLSGLRLVLVPTGILVALIPNVLIGVCGSDMMTCRSTTLPAVTILGILIAIGSAVQIGLLQFSARKEIQGTKIYVNKNTSYSEN